VCVGGGLFAWGLETGGRVGAEGGFGLYGHWKEKKVSVYKVDTDKITANKTDDEDHCLVGLL
jgi:hypothetical protein